MLLIEPEVIDAFEYHPDMYTYKHINLYQPAFNCRFQSLEGECKYTLIKYYMSVSLSGFIVFQLNPLSHLMRGYV